MIPVGHFHNQQERVRQLAQRIEHEVGAHQVADATLVILDIARLTGLVAVHVGQVDRALLPLLSGDADDDARLLVRRFRDRCCGLADLVRVFNRRWLGFDVIQADPIAFRVDVHQLLCAITERIDEEDALFARVGDERPSVPVFGIESMRPPLPSPAA